VKHLAGVTVNDVALAIVGGALRGFLQVRGMLPERALVARIPVGMAESGSISRAEGNRVAFLHTSLATDIPDSWERLQRIGAVTAEAKRCLDLEGRELLADWLESLPPILAAPLRRRVKFGANVVVSNLRGPSNPWQLGDSVVEEIYMAPPCHGIGINFLLWDYANHLMFGCLSSAGSVTNLGELATQLSGCLEELVAAAECHRLSTK
jgi:hypothetical protein